MVKIEQRISQEIRLALSNNGCKVFRINVGMFYDKLGRPIRTGVPNGFSDLFGFRVSDGKVFFIEVKDTKGRIRPEQEQFLRAMKESGALCGIARSVEDALNIIKGE